MVGFPRFLVVPVFFLMMMTGCNGNSATTQEPQLPGGAPLASTPVLLAPGSVNTGAVTRDAAMTPDGRSLYYCMASSGYSHAVILVTAFENGAWTEPTVAPFSGSPEWIDLEPFISPDGKRFFFMSTRPEDGQAEGEADIWVMDRETEGWGKPRNLGAPVNTDQAEYFPAVTADGTLYFTRADEGGRLHRIFRSRLVSGRYQEPELLPEEVNCGVNRFNATISPDESRLILAAVGVPGSHGAVDYFLVTRDTTDTWTGPLNLGPVINDGSARSWSPYVTPDGGAFLFMSSRRTGPDPGWPVAWGDLQTAHRTAGGGNPSIFQVSADILDSLAAGRPAPIVATEMLADPIETEPVVWPELTGSYLGQIPPGVEPKMFAPDLVSTGMNERDLLVHGDGKTLWYGFMGQGLVTILETRLSNGRWTEPTPVPFHLDREFACFEPALSADGRRVLFLSNRAAPGQEQGRGWANQNIFSSRLVDGYWSEPEALPAPVTSAAAEYFPSLAKDGTLYFTREDADGSAIWSTEPVGEGFREPVRLPEEVNVGGTTFNATAAPDESWIIVCVSGHEANLGPADYWISFWDDQGRWRPAVNLSEPFNGPGLRASSMSLSPDGRYLFFSTNRTKNTSKDRLERSDMLRLHHSAGHGGTDIWWVDVNVLEEFK